MNIFKKRKERRTKYYQEYKELIESGMTTTRIGINQLWGDYFEDAFSQYNHCEELSEVYRLLDRAEAILRSVDDNKNKE